MIWFRASTPEAPGSPLIKVRDCTDENMVVIENESPTMAKFTPSTNKKPKFDFSDNFSARNYNQSL